MWLRFALVVLVLVVAQAVLVAAAAARRRGNIYTTLIAVVCLMAPAVWFAGPALTGSLLTGDGRFFLVLLHLSLGGFLFHFMTLPDRSVTLRILVELERAPGRTLSLAALGERYSVRDMIDSRLRQMADGGFIRLEPDGRIAIEPRGAAFGRFVTGGRRLFNIASAN